MISSSLDTSASGPISVGSDRLGVAVSARRSKADCTIQITPNPNARTQGQRLLLVAERLCELDFALVRLLSRGTTIKIVVSLAGADESTSPADMAFRATDLVRPLLLPRRVSDSLYGYQRRGVAWLLRHKRALLADDMGLGKTAQALAGVRRLIRGGRIRWAIVVAPRTLVANWIAEAALWAPELCVLAALPSAQEREAIWTRVVGRAHIVVTSYEQLRDPPRALSLLSPDLLIADEAHRLRRGESQSTQGFRSVRSEWLWALSGTPVERDAEDLAVLMSLLEPSRFSSEDKDLHPSSLRAHARPYLLRRLKSDVMSELPPVIEREERLELTAEQASAYRQAIAKHGMLRGSGSYISLFGELRTLCDVEPLSGKSSKLERISELLSDIAAAGEKAVVFSYILAPLRELARRLDRSSTIKYTILTGDMSLPEREAALSRFKGSRDCSALLASSRVGAEGLTLVEANHVLFVNRWWNPSANAQARDRVVRIGQAKTVFVWTFSCKGTVESRLDAILRSKQQTFEDLIQSLATPEAGRALQDLFSEPD